MPLVIPGIMSKKGGDSQNEWADKLMGKKLSDGPSDEISFAKHDLPKEHRVIPAGETMMTMDHNPNRMNIHLAEDGTVRHVDFK
ncbi:MAG: hypothetical protein M1834_008091 [Cirrosporium novae-zelandiae]|nr:MAG: hypothetical protein M1834_008091 [Cirrosporium novae-zelandiae]